jgi:cell division septation protein DedD
VPIANQTPAPAPIPIANVQYTQAAEVNNSAQPMPAQPPIYYGNVTPAANNVTEVQPVQAPAVSNISTRTQEPVAQEVVPPLVTDKIVKPQKISQSKSLKVKAQKKTVIARYWAVQVGCFANASRAKGLAHTLSAKGFHVRTEKTKTSHGTLTRVLVGKESSKEKALSVSRDLKQTQQLTGTVVKVEK